MRGRPFSRGCRQASCQVGVEKEQVGPPDLWRVRKRISFRKVFTEGGNSETDFLKTVRARVPFEETVCAGGAHTPL